MERATPVELRRSMQAANALKDAGLKFVPMPVLNKFDHDTLATQLIARMDAIEAIMAGGV